MILMGKDEFLAMPAGTPFCFGKKWYFNRMLIKDESLIFDNSDSWGFWAIDPCWVDEAIGESSFDILEGMVGTGISKPMETCATKYMNYDTDDMDLFMVFEEDDWKALNEMTNFNKTDGEQCG